MLARAGDGNLLPTSGRDTTTHCRHGFEIFGKESSIEIDDFNEAFREAFSEAYRAAFDEATHKGIQVVQSLVDAGNATWDELPRCGMILPRWNWRSQAYWAEERGLFLKEIIDVLERLLCLLGSWSNTSQ